MQKKPCILIIRDGWGINPGGSENALKNGDATLLADTPLRKSLYPQNMVDPSDILKKFILPIIYTLVIGRKEDTRIQLTLGWKTDSLIKRFQGGGTKFCYILRPFLKY